MAMDIKKATSGDKNSLILMNLHLMEDEQFDRPLSKVQLEDRWDEFLMDPKYLVVLFQKKHKTIGYAVVHLFQTPYYLRHFFIQRNQRRKGLGKECFYLLLEYLKTSKIDLDVMSWNERGLSFWSSLGFKERCKMMTFEK